MNVITKYIGWRNWAVLNYNAVFENIFVVFYIALLDSRYDAQFIIDSFVLILFSILATTYGYLINDYSDIELDRKHGKANTFQNDSRFKAVVVIVAVAILSVLSCYPFWTRKYFAVLALTWLLIATFYSLKPIRLKERGTLGIIFVVMAQRVLPVLIIFSTFEFGRAGEIVLLTLYILFRGFSSDVNHQLQDYLNDKQTGTATFAVSKGYRHVKRLFYFSLHSERILLAVILIHTGFVLPLKGIGLRGLFWSLIAVYFIALFAHYVKAIRDADERYRNPFETEKRNLVQFLHHAYPSVVLPFGLNFILMIHYIPFLLLLLMQIITKRLYSIDIIRQSFIFQVLGKIFKIRG